MHAMPSLASCYLYRALSFRSGGRVPCVRGYEKARIAARIHGVVMTSAVLGKKNTIPLIGRVQRYEEMRPNARKSGKDGAETNADLEGEM
jgi:hypothetical protein